jgi:hypothetical protein
MHKAMRSARSKDGLLAAMARAEEEHERQQQQRVGKRARLLEKLESGRAVPVPATAGGALPDALLQAGARQLAAALATNAALPGQLIGHKLDGVAAQLVQQLAASHPSKPIFQSKLANLVLQLRKAGAAADVPALQEVLAGRQQQDIETAGSPANPAADAATALSPGTLQQAVTDAVKLADAVSADSTLPAQAQAAIASLAALQALPVTADLLQQTGAGRRVHHLRKHSHPGVAAAAVAAVQAWKATLAAAAAAPSAGG